MKVLSIDTSSNVGGITLLSEGNILNFKIEDTRRIAENIYGFIDNVLRSAGISLDEIDLFSTVLGPGSFTGLRVSISVVKSIAFALSKPVIGLETFYVMAYKVLDDMIDFDYIIVIGNARRGELFCSVYARDLTEVEEIRVIGYNELRSIGNRYTNALYVLRDDEILRDVGPLTRIVVVDKDLSSIVAVISSNLYKEGKRTDISELNPIYVRDDIFKKTG